MRPDRILLFSTVILAATAAQASGSGEEQIIVTATRSEQPLSRIGQAVTVVTQQDLAREQGVVVSDVLARTPGITFSRNGGVGTATRSEEHTYELQSLMRISYAVFCLKKNNTP